MARPLRIEFSGAFYRLTARGDRRETIYEDDEGRSAFLSTFADVVEQFEWRCHADCLMTNHYHLFVETVHATGEYSYAAIPELFGLHFTTVARIVRKTRRQMART